MRQDLGDQLPVAEVAEHEDDRSAPTQFAVHFVHALDRDQRHHLLERHGV